MTKQKFIDFSLEKEETINEMLSLFDYQSFNFRWDDLKDIIVKNSITVINIINILKALQVLDIKIKQDKFDFFRFVCGMLDKGFEEKHVVSKYINLTQIK